MPRSPGAPLPLLLAGLLACSPPRPSRPTVLLVSGTPHAVASDATRHSLNPGDVLNLSDTLLTPPDALLVVSCGPSGFALLPESRVRIIPFRRDSFGLELLDGSVLVLHGSTNGFPVITTTATLRPNSPSAYAILRAKPDATRFRIYQGSFLVSSNTVTRTDTLLLLPDASLKPSPIQEPEAARLPLGLQAFRLHGTSTVHVTPAVPADLLLDDAFLVRLPASFLLADNRPHRLLVRASRRRDISTNLTPGLPQTVQWSPEPPVLSGSDAPLAPSTGPALAVGDTLILASTPAELTALSTISRTVLWRVPIPDSPSSFLLHPPHLVVRTASHILCILSESGRVLWTYRTGSTVTGVVTVDDLVCYAERNGLLHARNIRNGTLVWSFRTLHPSVHLLLVDPYSLIATTQNGTLIAVDPTTGTLLWQTSARRRPSPAPAAALGRHIIFPCRNGDLVRLGPDRTPRVIRTGHSKDILLLEAAPPVVALAFSDGTLLGIDPVHLSRRWHRTSSAVPTALACGPDGHLYAAFNDGTVFKLSAATGELLDSATYPEAVRDIVFTDRETFVSTSRGLYTF